MNSIVENNKREQIDVNQKKLMFKSSNNVEENKNQEKLLASEVAAQNNSEFDCDLTIFDTDEGVCRDMRAKKEDFNFHKIKH